MGGPVPRKEFVDPVYGMIGDAIDDVGEVGVRVDAAHFAGLDDGVDDGGTLTAGV
ncbi:hypothetical protein GGE07_001415 [Sinorhizobium terangae]|nr:hypothetical protein [Sinorhizobium terangae]